MTPVSYHTILVDGYNLALRRPEWAGLRLEQMRDRLRSLLQQTRWPFPQARITVVFDAKSPAAVPGTPWNSRVSPEVSGGIRVTFVTSADAEIQRRIRDAAEPERLAVVSDDGEIIRTAKSHRVRVFSCAWVLDHSAPPRAAGRASTKGSDASDKTSLPASQARSITKELERKWLRGDGQA